MVANILYLAALAFVSPLVLYRMVRHGRYRRGASEKLFGLSRFRAQSLRSDSDLCLWLHAVSVGEVNLLPGIVRELESRNPNYRIAISTSTDTGYDVAIKHFGHDRVFFCPLDFSWAVKRTIRNLAPSRLILAELELWPNLIRAATQAGCDVLVMNARLSQKSASGYQRFGSLTRSTFANLAWIGCQDESCANRFQECGTDRSHITVTGSLKFDDAPRSRDTPEIHSRQQWAGVDPWHRVWIFGSTQAGEEKLALTVYRTLSQSHPEMRLILVPRHPERFESVANLIRDEGYRVHRRSRDESLFQSEWKADTVLLIDTIGELRHWWGVAHIATVGGSFGSRGGQNMLEPAGYGAAVSFGPNTRNFAEIANRLLNANAAVRVTDKPSLQAFVERCLTDIPSADRLGTAAQGLIDAHRGATSRTISAIEASVGKQSVNPDHQRAA